MPKVTEYQPKEARKHRLSIDIHNALQLTITTMFYILFLILLSEKTSIFEYAKVVSLLSVVLFMGFFLLFMKYTEVVGLVEYLERYLASTTEKELTAIKKRKRKATKKKRRCGE